MKVYLTTNQFGQKAIVQVQAGSNNSKTGESVQIWIMPYAWITEGKDAMEDDSAACMDCPHSRFADRLCYVRKGPSNWGLKSKVASLHKAFNTGRLEVLPIEDLAANEAKTITGQFVRFGAYGEPVLLGEENVAYIAANAAGYTGYTHQWRQPKYQWASKYFMASVETQPLMDRAHDLGWRTFRVSPKGTAPVTGKEITCPASEEAGRRAKCNTCGLCKGASSKAKSIHILIH